MLFKAINDSAVFKHIILIGHQIDVNDLTIFDRENYWFLCGVKEAVWDRTKSASLYWNEGTRIMILHSWDHSINTLCSVSAYKKIPEVRNQP